MGSGKSTIGKLLASRLSLSFVDLDEIIVEQHGKNIPQIFMDDGEDIFRLVEHQCLDMVLQGTTEQVVSTGGGVILSPANRTLMKAKGKVVWLHATPEILALRISGDSNRPLLEGVDVLQKMKDLSQQRNHLYAEIADLKIDTGLLSDKEAVAKIVDFLSE